MLNCMLGTWDMCMKTLRPMNSPENRNKSCFKIYFRKLIHHDRAVYASYTREEGNKRIHEDAVTLGLNYVRTDQPYMHGVSQEESFYNYIIICETLKGENMF